MYLGSYGWMISQRQRPVWYINCVSEMGSCIFNQLINSVATDVRVKSEGGVVIVLKCGDLRSWAPRPYLPMILLLLPSMVRKAGTWNWKLKCQGNCCLNGRRVCQFNEWLWLSLFLCVGVLFVGISLIFRQVLLAILNVNCGSGCHWSRVIGHGWTGWKQTARTATWDEC